MHFFLKYLVDVTLQPNNVDVHIQDRLMHITNFCLVQAKKLVSQSHYFKARKCLFSRWFCYAYLSILVISFLFVLYIVNGIATTDEQIVADSHDQHHAGNKYLKISSQPPTFSSNSFFGQSSLVKYKQYLFKIYRERAFPVYSKPQFTVNRPKHPLNLVLVHKEQYENHKLFTDTHSYGLFGEVDKIRRQKQPIAITEIGTINRNNVLHFVLIEGAPGVGKSTLCWQLCGLWSESKLQYTWDLVVLIEIREETTRNATSVYDLLYHPDDDIRKSVAQEVQKREGEGLMIIFDGYDEVSNDQRSEHSVFQKILTYRLLRKATVVVTSRPSAFNSLPSQFKQILYQHIEIAGFSKTDIRKYISLACENNTDLLKDLRSFVSSQPFILSVIYNPLHCTIVTELYIQYWKDGRKGFAPNTLTELYNVLVINLLKHNVSPTLLSSDIEELTDLPKPVYNNLMQLAELAANGTEKKMYLYNNVRFATLGLMVSVRQLYNIQPKRSANMFLHLTLQEYLTAFYWSHQPPQKLAGFMKQQPIYSIIEQHQKGIEKGREHEVSMSIQWTFLRFLAGFTKLKYFLYEEMNESLITTNIGSLCQILFEANSAELVSKFFSNKRIYIRNYYLQTLFNWYMLGYCIANSDNTSTWTIQYRVADLFLMLSDGLHYFADTIDLNKGSGPKIEIFLPDHGQNVFNDGQFYDVFPRLYPFTRLITKLNFDMDIVSDGGVSLLHNVSYYCPNLEVLLLPQFPNNYAMMTEAPTFPRTLVHIGLSLSQHSVVFDNLHKCQALKVVTLKTDHW